MTTTIEQHFNAPSHTTETKPTPATGAPLTTAISSRLGAANPTLEKRSKADQREYARHLKVIRNGMQEMVSRSMEIGEALLEVRDKSLYRPDYRNFADFCAAELEIAKTRAYELTSAAKVFREFSAMAEFHTKPAMERQIRPLTRLKEKNDREKAWHRALELAEGKPVREADVVRAVKELKGSGKKEQEPEEAAPVWRTQMIERFAGQGFETVKEQPVKWMYDATDLYSPASGTYLKLISELTPDEIGCILALKGAAVNCRFIVNANRVPEYCWVDEDGEFEESFKAVYHFLAKELDLLFEEEGVLYAAGELNTHYRTTFRRVPDERLAELGLLPDGPSGDGGDSLEALAKKLTEPKPDDPPAKSVASKKGGERK